jgi:outer membrane receptor for ferrienterochelin and colicin
LHGKSLQVRSDNNEDAFLDVPLSNHFIGMNRWKYMGSNGFRMQFGVKAIYMDQIGGQVDFSPSKHKLDTNVFGLGINTRKVEAFGKFGYVFPKNKFSSFGLQVSAMNHSQKSYFGTRIYNADQESGYANLIYQSIIGNTQHKIKLGASYLYDKYDEILDTVQYSRTENIPGVFAEYTYAPVENMTLVAGLRADHHNFYGTFLVPRLHLRYCMFEKTVFRGSIGKGWRTANVIAENIGILASSRALVLLSENNWGFGLDAEEAWNYGFNITQEFTLDYRDGNIGFDYYRTDFNNQIIADYEQSANQLWFYNLEGPSYSNSLQLTFNYELLRRLDIRMAYRWFDVKMSYGTEWDPVNGVFQGNELLTKPLMAVNRSFVNLSYSSKRKWDFDFTVQWQGEKRVPYHPLNIEEPEAEDLVVRKAAPSFFILNSQITKTFGTSLDFYLGVENIANFRQNNPILSAENPFGEYFDGSLVWGPIFGRMAYFGVRYTLE